MTAPTKTIRTPGEAELIERFAGAHATLSGTDAVKRLREEAFAAFERQGLPHRRVEAWKYSDLRNRLKTAVPLAARPGAEASTAALKTAADAFFGITRHRLVLIDGFLDPGLSDGEALKGEGVEVASVAEALSVGDDGSADLLSVPEIAGNDVALALNTAFAADGVVVRVGEGARPSKPIEIVNIVSRERPHAVHARNRVVLGNGAEATFLESVAGGCEASEINSATEYRTGDETKLTVARLQATNAGATQIATNIVRLGAGAELKHLSVEAGGGFSRNQTFVTFAGAHARADILGVSMLDDRRHVDQTLVVDHAAPHCDGTELFKTVLDGRSHGVFQGQIVVRRGAQKTNSKMMSQALLLSEEAEMDSKPELEIFADDVVCGHGATSGQIDRTMLFYLMARGIPRAEAERLLVEAFLADAIDALGDEAIADALKRRVSGWLGARDGRSEEVAA
jgi:Fe-S cluster assembly protein SufD